MKTEQNGQQGERQPDTLALRAGTRRAGRRPLLPLDRFDAEQIDPVEGTWRERAAKRRWEAI